MKRRSKNKRFLVLPILMAFVTIVLLIFGSSLLTTPKSAYFNQLGSGWSICRGDKVYSDITLSNFIIDDSRKGEKITISRTISPNGISSPTIMFKSSLASVVVDVDGKEVYSFGTEYSDRGLFVPKKYNMITLEDGVNAYDISITYTVAENNSFKGFYPIYLGAKRDLVKNFFQYHRLTIFGGSFFIIYSCLLFSLGVFLLLNSRPELSVFFSSALSMLLGVYTYAYNDIFCFVSDKDNVLSILEYVSLYLLPLALSVLLLSTHPKIASSKQRFLLGVNIAMPVVFWIIHLSGIAHIEIFVMPLQIIGVIEIVFILPSLVKGLLEESKKRRESDTYTGIDADNYLLLGFIIMIFFILLEIGKYNALRFDEIIGKRSVMSGINFLNLGMLYFIICLFIYYFLNGIDHMNASKIKKQLEGLAYTDALTGLMNRAKCMQYAATLDGAYAVVSLDLDKLKTVNDTFGHLEGDRMIKSFAELLEKSFKGANLIGRTGGDEFLAVFENPDAGVCDKCINALMQSMDDFNKKNERFTLSASVGYAYSSEVAKGDYEEIFYLADSRMYKMKESHHD